MGDIILMVKWKLFGKSKKEEETTQQVDLKQETEEKTFEEATNEEQTDGPIAEYHETLHTGTTTSKSSSNTASDSEQRRWRDVDSIEEDIDTLHVKKTKVPVTELDKKVDKILEKNKEKHKKKE